MYYGEEPYQNGREKRMDDRQIVDLYWERSEKAISETSKKYGKYCSYIAYNILHNREDCEECVNDTYMKAWNAMPPQRPNRLSAFLGKITRNLSLNRYAKYTAGKRGAGQTELVLEELQECIPASDHVEQVIDDMLLAETINSFLDTLPSETRRFFVRRYWYLSPVREIASDYTVSESKVKMSLMRARNKLKKILEEEGISL